MGKKVESSTEEEKNPPASEPSIKKPKTQSTGENVSNALPKSSVSETQKIKQPELKLPTDKVHFTETVKQFALSWNHFNEENDKVVVLEQVQIVQEAPTAPRPGLQHPKIVRT